MNAAHDNNRSMFWRIVRRLVFAHRGRLFVILLALGAGAAVTAALLNLQVDAKRRITTEFRAFGANVLVLPRNASPSDSATLPESIVHSVPLDLPRAHVSAKSVLYFVAAVSSAKSGKSVTAVVAGTNPFGILRTVVSPTSHIAMEPVMTAPQSDPVCIVGTNAARLLNAQQDSQLNVTVENRLETCQIATLSTLGGPEDNLVTTELRAAQHLAALPGRISALELVVPGTPDEIQTYIAGLQRALPDAEVRPVRQFTDAQAKIYNRVSGLLSVTVVIVLLLTGLCLMAAMTNVAMERKNDVGLMKAIGGATRRVLRLFLAEAALLGVAGGVIGAAVGIFLSIWLGKQVFGVAAQPRLIVYPISVALTTIVAILSAYPLRRLASVRPASVFRGEA